MTSDTPPVRPLDARDAQPRTEGYIDAEISEIMLIEGKSNELPQLQPQAAAAAAAAADQDRAAGSFGVLYSLRVARRLVTGFLPSVETDIVKLTGRDRSLPERSRAGAFLAVKLAFVALICFAIGQELLPRMIYTRKVVENNVSRAAGQPGEGRDIHRGIIASQATGSPPADNSQYKSVRSVYERLKALDSDDCRSRFKITSSRP